ncbi:hypothetical protein E5K00_20340 [Hymenobacter aquaticus]|uniref:DUF6089 domain-containing protein n=1 Tax=Hymenobacter aquaticus TaxID=1867101 RepID=A0A4Z0PTZ3_9BACT|nr:DUF6089 family protein [Hymenobacter aquaticus]TGE20353.1 hypothetical protein E5K00_20340 [Hymenobacter aquaticus]
MKQFFTHILALLLVVSLVASEANAQQFSKRKQYNSVGVSLNAMNYFGDIVPKASIPSLRFAATRPNIGVNITHRFAPRISARVALAYGQITGDDEKAADKTDPDARFRYHRNMNFRNNIFEVSAVGIFDLIANRNNYIKRPDFVPYVFAGVAVFHHNPRGEVRGGDIAGTGVTQGAIVNLQPLRTEGVDYALTNISIPFGGGVRYKLNKSFDIGLEIGWRKTFTDYLDDVSGVYIDQAKLGSAEARYFGRGITRTDDGTFINFNVPGEMRGKGNEKDWYIVTGLNVNYILAPRVKSPKFR